MFSLIAATCGEFDPERLIIGNNRTQISTRLRADALQRAGKKGKDLLTAIEARFFPIVGITK
jgi:hypothetical protein